MSAANTIRGVFMNKMLAALIVTVAIVSGCSSLPEGSLKKPELTYLRTDITGVSMDKVNANIVFSAVNPNPVPLIDIVLNYQLFMEGQQVAKGDRLMFGFFANTRTDFVVPVEVRYDSFFKSAANLTQAVLGGKKTVSFEIRSTLFIDLKMITVEMPLNGSGEFPLPGVGNAVKFPKIKF